MSKWNLQEMFHLFKLRGFLNLQLCLKFRLVFYTNQHVSLSEAFPLPFANNEKETTNIEKKWKYINWTISFWKVDSNWHFWALVEVHSRRWRRGKESTGNARDTCFIPGGEDPLKKEMATQSSILTREIPRRGACSPPSSSLHGILQARILEQVATPTSSGSSPPRDQTQVSHIAGGFFTIWATREAYFSVLFTNLLYTDMY